MGDIVKIRDFPEANYKSVFFNDKTIRFTYDSKKPIKDLEFPEFYDVSVTHKCNGNCPYCYQDSIFEREHTQNILAKVLTFFEAMNQNERPFQIAYGGGEPTLHPQFIQLLKLTRDLGIVPNYTTNGMNISKELLEATKKYCGGIALTCHPHLRKYWEKATSQFVKSKIRTFFHIIISDKESIVEFLDIYKKYRKKVEFFVLLPYLTIGRAEQKEVDFDFLFNELKELSEKSKIDINQIVFGAKFYPRIKKEKWLDISIYEPEIMSKYLDLETMSLYKSSFEEKPIKQFELKEGYYV